ncbi:MAG: hypothetical protein ACOCW7_00250 [Bacteroidota bacterium]
MTGSVEKSYKAEGLVNWGLESVAYNLVQSVKKIIKTKETRNFTKILLFKNISYDLFQDG